MEPYYEDDHCVIYHGDCRDVLPTLGAVDLVLTDPPYGIEYVSNWRNRTTQAKGEHQRPIKGDAINPVDVLAAVRRLMADGSAVYWFTTERGIGEFYAAAEALHLTPRRSLVWDKQLHGMGDLTGDWGVRTEYIPWASKSRHILRGGRRANIISVVHEANRARLGAGHPTEKPIGALLPIIEASSDPGDLVLDPFMGSGSTLVAAKRASRRAIGIEMEERYCEVAAERLGGPPRFSDDSLFGGAA